MSDPERPWKVGGLYGKKFSDRWPTTLLTARHGGTYRPRGGLLLSSEHVTIRCGYAADGRSMDKGCEQWSKAWGVCTPGCSPQTAVCDREKDVQSYNNMCAWPAGQLELLTRQQEFMDTNYNEIVIDPASIAASLPHSVLAVFFQPGGGEDDRAESARVHQTFLSDYPNVGGAAHFPLLEYTFEKGAGAPSFRCVVCGDQASSGRG